MISAFHLLAETATTPDASSSEAILLSLVLLAAAAILLFLEILFISFGILGVGSLLCVCFSIYQAFTVSAEFGTGLLFATPLLAVIVVRYGIKRIQNSSLAPDSAIEAQAGARSHTNQLGVDVGSVGTLLTNVAPGGRCRFDGGVCDVITHGLPLDAGQRVVVKAIDGPTILVGAHNEPEPSPPSSPEEH